MSLPPIDGRKLFHATAHVDGCVERARRFMFAEVVEIRVSRFLFKQMRAIQQHDFSQIASRLCTNNLTAKPVSHQHRQIAAVVEMSVAQDNRINFPWRHRKRGPVAQSQRLKALKQATVEQYPLVARFDKVA